jgi:hypothetical protein
MRALILPLIFSAVVLVPRIPKFPELRYVGDGIHAAFNPLQVAITMNVSCGSDWENVQVVLGPGEKRDLDFTAQTRPSTNSRLVCSMVGYTKNN